MGGAPGRPPRHAVPFLQHIASEQIGVELLFCVMKKSVHNTTLLQFPATQLESTRVQHAFTSPAEGLDSQSGVPGQASVEDNNKSTMLSLGWGRMEPRSPVVWHWLPQCEPLGHFASHRSRRFAISPKTDPSNYHHNRHAASPLKITSHKCKTMQICCLLFVKTKY